MAVLTFNLPVPAGDGAGAAVDCSTLGGARTLVCGGTLSGVIHVEVTNEAIPSAWVEIASFGGAFPAVASGKRTLEIAARHMRCRVTDYVAGAGNVDVGGDDAGSAYLNLPAPAGDGVGGSINVSALEIFRSVVVAGPAGGPFAGVVTIEVSEDGTDWAQCPALTGPGVLSGIMPSVFMRVRRSNVAGSAGGTPIVDVGGAGIGSQGLVCGFTPGAVIFAGTDGCLDEDPASLFFDTSLIPVLTPKLGVGTNAPEGRIESRINFLGATVDDTVIGFALHNSQVTTVTAQSSASPLFVFEGQVWATGGGGVSVEEQWGVQLVPITGSAGGDSELRFFSNTDDSGFVERIAFFHRAGGQEGAGIRITKNGGGAVSNDTMLSLLLLNSALAVAGTQQFSPMLVLEGQGFATGGVVSMEVQGGIQVRAVQGVLVPSAEITFFTNVNDLGFTEQMRLDTILGAEETSMWLRCQHTADMERVSVNPTNDSGGAGFRTLRVPNA